MINIIIGRTINISNFALLLEGKINRKKNIQSRKCYICYLFGKIKDLLLNIFICVSSNSNYQIETAPRVIFHDD